MKKKLTLTLNEDDTHCILCAAFDYSFGRKTYMPSVFMNVIREHLEEIPMCTLRIIDMRLDKAERDYRDLWQQELKERGWTNYGMECDRHDWQAFHRWLKDVIAKRKQAKKMKECVLRHSVSKAEARLVEGYICGAHVISHFYAEAGDELHQINQQYCADEESFVIMWNDTVRGYKKLGWEEVK